MRTVKLQVSDALYSNFEKVSKIIADPKTGLGFSPGVEILMSMQLAEDDPKTMAVEYCRGFAKMAQQRARDLKHDSETNSNFRDKQ